MNRKKHHSVIERVEQARLQSQINQNFANELIQSIEEEKKSNQPPEDDLRGATGYRSSQ